MGHRFKQRVYYSDTDAGGIVYHARYLDFAEHARTELLRYVYDSEQPQRQQMMNRRIGYVVKSVNVKYHRVAYLDDVLEVETTIESAKRFSLTFLQEITRDGESIATLTVRVASINLDTLKIQPFDPKFAEIVNAL